MNHPEREVWTAWLAREIDEYVDNKFDQSRPEHDDNLHAQGCGKGSFWYNQVMRYPVRANVVGLDTMYGRQLLLKGLAAYAGMVESMIRVYGEPPTPGYVRGEIH